MSKLRVGYAGVAFSTYYAEENDQYNRAIRGLEVMAAELDFELVAIPYGLTDDDLVAQAAAQLKSAEIDFLLLEAATCGSGDALIMLSKVAPRMGIWSTPDPKLEGGIQIHGLVMLNQYSSIIQRYLRHEQIDFKWFWGHADSAEFRKRFGITVRALKAVKAMSEARVGWIGGLSPGFYDMEFDAGKLKQRLGGAHIVSHELAEIVDLAKSIPEKEARAVSVDVTAAGSEIRVSTSNMDKGSRIYLALKELAARHNYSSLAMECWPQMQSQYNLAPCMSMGWLGSEDGMAVSCEGDVMGALSMQLLNELIDAHGSSTLLDMTQIDPEHGSMLMWHCGVSPRHWANSDGIKWVDHPTLGRKMTDGPYGVTGDQVFAAQETSIAYIGDSGDSLLVMKSQIIDRDDAKGYDGTRGWFNQFELNKNPIELWDLMNTIVVRGIEHHFAIGQGDVTDELMECAAWWKMNLVEPIPRREYLQVPGINC